MGIVRYLDKLIDEYTNSSFMDKILRERPLSIVATNALKIGMSKVYMLRVNR